MESKPLVSIIIPVYNVQAYIEACIVSSLNQTYKNLEIICVNDGSTDNSRNIIKNYQSRDSRIKLVDKENGGLPSARKVGIKAATGNFIFHLDGDDNIPADAIEQLVEVALNTGADIIVGDYESGKDGIERTEYIDLKIKEDMSGPEYMDHILRNVSFNIWGKLINSKLYKNPITIPDDISIGEDLIHVYQLASYANKIAPCHHSVYKYYMHTTSMSFNKNIRFSLYNKSIYSLVFLAGLKDAHKKLPDMSVLKKYMANYLYNYYLSPHPVSIRREELKTLLSFVDFNTIRNYRNPLKFTALCAAKVNLGFGQAIVNIAKKFV